MRYSASDKIEIIRLVEESNLPVRWTTELRDCRIAVDLGEESVYSSKETFIFSLKQEDCHFISNGGTRSWSNLE